jgi:hypothetical protein
MLVGKDTVTLALAEGGLLYFMVGLETQRNGPLGALSRFIGR